MLDIKETMTICRIRKILYSISGVNHHNVNLFTDLERLRNSGERVSKSFGDSRRHRDRIKCLGIPSPPKLDPRSNFRRSVVKGPRTQSHEQKRPNHGPGIDSLSRMKNHQDTKRSWRYIEGKLRLSSRIAGGAQIRRPSSSSHEMRWFR